MMGVATPFSALVLLLRMHFVTFANPRQMHAILEIGGILLLVAFAGITRVTSISFASSSSTILVTALASARLLVSASLLA
jgi:hypothetical protein